MVENAAAGPSFQPPEPVRYAADLALERKARDVVVLDLRGISSATDYFVIATGNSDVQVRAIGEHVLGELKGDEIRPGHVEGMRGGRWILLDYIDFVVHVFHPEAREFYQLETLWGDAGRLELGDGDEATDSPA